MPPCSQGPVGTCSALARYAAAALHANAARLLLLHSQTMSIHHDKHHAVYVKGVNDALAKHPELKVQRWHHRRASCVVMVVIGCHA